MRKLYATPTFERLSHRFTEKNPILKQKLITVMNRLADDVFDSSLKIHKLHGLLKDYYACRITYDQRIVFSFDDTTVILWGIGSHGEIY